MFLGPPFVCLGWKQEHDEDRVLDSYRMGVCFLTLLACSSIEGKASAVSNVYTYLHIWGSWIDRTAVLFLAHLGRRWRLGFIGRRGERRERRMRQSKTDKMLEESIGREGERGEREVEDRRLGRWLAPVGLDGYSACPRPRYRHTSARQSRGARRRALDKAI